MTINDDDVISEVAELVHRWRDEYPTDYPTTVHLPRAYAEAVLLHVFGPDVEGRDPFEGQLLGMDMEQLEDGPPRVG